MKKEKLRHYGNVIASHADAPWVTPLFFFLFLIDSVILFLPVDALLGTASALRPQYVKKWCLASILGFAVGLGLVALLVHSQLQPTIFHAFEQLGYLEKARKVIDQANNYGYLKLTLGVFTVLPSLFGVLIGVLMGLNPWLVWLISLGGKVLKLALTVWLLFSTGSRLRKPIEIYLKTSV